MSSNKKPTAAAIGAALAGGLVLSGSAFAMTSLAQGYMLSASSADAAAKSPEGSCGAEHKAGMKAGDEAEVEVTFPENWRVADLAGKAAKVSLKVTKVSAATLPEEAENFK